MGNSQTTEEKARSIERQLLNLSGLELDKEIHIIDVKINFLGENYIHTYLCGETNKEIMILIHGYGGSSIFFYKILKDLSDKYKVYCFDLLGMGLSSRPQFNCETAEETINFFIESFEHWRINLKLDKFILLGHSFGGYMACQYANVHKERVLKLILLSPLGCTKRNLVEDEEYQTKIVKHMSFFQRIFNNLRLKFWRDKLTPSYIANKYEWLFGPFLKGFFSKRFRINKDTGNMLWEFIILTFRLPLSSEKALHLIVNAYMSAFIPLENIIYELDLPILIVYGDKDWMDDYGSKRILRSGSVDNFILDYVDDCGHQLTMENPSELLKVIFNSGIFDIKLKKCKVDWEY